MFCSERKFIYIIGVLLLLGVTSASAAVVTVTSADPGGWFVMDQAGAATGAVTTTEPRGPGNTGSLEYSTSGSLADIISAARIPLVRVNAITGIGYDFYSSDDTFAPSLKIQYWNPVRFGTLVYEPYNNGGAITTNTWFTADATAGNWWSSEFGGGDVRTFAEWQTELGDIPVTFLQVGVGSGWSRAMTGHADMVRLATAANDTTWDFEGSIILPPQPPAPAATSPVPTLSGWALIMMSMLFGLLLIVNRKRLF